MEHRKRAIRLIVLSAIMLAVITVYLWWLVSKLNAQMKDAIPLGLPADTWQFYVPKDNPPTASKIELGRELFFDARLSADGTISCSTCHDPNLAFADGRPVAEGIAGRLGTRNTPTLLNAMFNPAHFWDGRTDTLEQQAAEPLINPLEMGNGSHGEVIDRLRAIAGYRAAFLSVFGGDITIERVSQAIAAYERTLVSGDSPFDRFVFGDPYAISEAAKRGFALFYGKARCARCHTFPGAPPPVDAAYPEGGVIVGWPALFTDFAYHNTGVAALHPNFDRLARQAAAAAQTDRAKTRIDKLSREAGGQELGRMLVSYQLFDVGAFRTPSLRNVASTAPYFHNGSAKTLADVVKFYDAGGKHNINIDGELRALGLTEDERSDLVSFLECLTGNITEKGDMSNDEE
jgi:cytochrome c peroxidase